MKKESLKNIFRAIVIALMLVIVTGTVFLTACQSDDELPEGDLFAISDTGKYMYAGGKYKMPSAMTIVAGEPHSEITLVSSTSNFTLKGEYDTCYFENPYSEWASGKKAGDYLGIKLVHENGAVSPYKRALQFKKAFDEPIIVQITIEGSTAYTLCKIDYLASSEDSNSDKGQSGSNSGTNNKPSSPEQSGSDKEPSNPEQSGSVTPTTPMDSEYKIEYLFHGDATNLSDLSVTGDTKAKEGETVTFKITINDNRYSISIISTEVWNSGAIVEIKDNGNYSYSFTMPKGNITVWIYFEYTPDEQSKTLYSIEYATALVGISVVNLSCQSKATASEVVKFTATIKPEYADQYKISHIVVQLGSGEKYVDLESNNGIYTFTMPDAATMEAEENEGLVTLMLYIVPIDM